MLNFETNTPSTMDEPKRIFEEIRGYKARFKERFEIDHCMDGELDTAVAGADGQHNQITLVPQSYFPEFTNGAIKIFSKIIDGIIELCITVSDGVFQITKNGRLATFYIHEVKQSNLSYSLSKTIYGNGLFIFFTKHYVATTGAFTYIYSSPDGLTWTQRFSLEGYQYSYNTYGRRIDYIIYTGSRFLAITYFFRASSGNTYSTVVYGSSDGLTWGSVCSFSRGTVAGDYYFYCGASGNNVSVFGGYSGKIFKVNTDNTCSEIQTPVSYDIKDMVYGNSLFVAVASPSILYSSDGLTWNNSTYLSGNIITSVVVINSLFFFTCYSYDSTNNVYSHKIYTSSNCKNYTLIYSDSKQTVLKVLSKIFYNGLYYVCPCNPKALISFDLVTWEEIDFSYTVYNSYVDGLKIKIFSDSGTFLNTYKYKLLS